jgi:undecaprenyl-phosphate 4-deoxy-4-formamido-L-arabinose transferase
MTRNPPEPRAAAPAADAGRPCCSLVIPVFNAAGSIEVLVEEIHEVFAGRAFEVVLIDDGSTDGSEEACGLLVQRHGATVRFVRLARNFGEHSAVMAGLHVARGDYVVVLDDDGQHPAREALRLFDAICNGPHDVVYGRYVVKHHGPLRNLASVLNDRVATLLLRKPKGLYLSSFKAMNRFVVDEIRKYRGARPYVDGLVYRTTHNIAQIDVEHRQRALGRSNYGLGRLVALWLDTFPNFSILPLRFAGVLGLLCSGFSGVVLCLTIVDKLFLNAGITAGVPTLMITIAFFAGVQLLILGLLGEYLGRLFLNQSGAPQFVIRYVKEDRRDG